MKLGILFELRRKIERGCCCNNCKRHIIGDYYDENKCGSFVIKNQHLCKLKSLGITYTCLIRHDINKHLRLRSCNNDYPDGKANRRENRRRELRKRKGRL